MIYIERSRTPGYHLSIIFSVKLNFNERLSAILYPQTMSSNSSSISIQSNLRVDWEEKLAKGSSDIAIFSFFIGNFGNPRDILGYILRKQRKEIKRSEAPGLSRITKKRSPLILEPSLDKWVDPSYLKIPNSQNLLFPWEEEVYQILMGTLASLLQDKPSLVAEPVWWMGQKDNAKTRMNLLFLN